MTPEDYTDLLGSIAFESIQEDASFDFDRFEERANLIIRQAIQDERYKWQKIYVAVNEMMAPLGCYGEILARDDRVTAVMDALHAIDGGVYRK